MSRKVVVRSHRWNATNSSCTRRQLRWQQLQRIEIDAKVRISLDLCRNIVAADLATHRGGSSPSFDGQAYAPAASVFA